MFSKESSPTLSLAETGPRHLAEGSRDKIKTCFEENPCWGRRTYPEVCVPVQDSREHLNMRHVTSLVSGQSKRRRQAFDASFEFRCGQEIVYQTCPDRVGPGNL